MDIKERIEAFWAGQKPDRIPYTVLSFIWFAYKNEPEWGDLFKQGLGVTWYVSNFKKIMVNRDQKENIYTENGRTIKRITYTTPVGEIYQEEVVADNSTMGWVRKYFLKTPADYKVMTYITDNTEVHPAYQEYYAQIEKLPAYAVPDMIIGRSPMQSILIDYVGLENYAYHIYDYEDEMQKLYDSLEKLFAKLIDVVANGPGGYVNIRENFTSESLGPERYLKYHVPIYKKYIPILHASGKIVGTHYDGRLKSCSDLIAESPIDLIESLTPPNEGDMELHECRKKWPDKLFWSNIRLGDYNLPPEKLRERIHDLIKQGSPDGKRFAFEISEDIPQNWKTSVPIVLDVLNNYNN